MSKPLRCLVTSCTGREVREYQAPSGPEVYCARHAQMLIWAEHVKTLNRDRKGKDD